MRQPVRIGLRLLKPQLGGFGLLQRLHLLVLKTVLAPRLFDFRKLGRERRLLLEVRKAVRVTRERRVPLCVGLPEGFRGILRGLGRLRRVQLQKFRHLRRTFPELLDRLAQLVGL